MNIIIIYVLISTESVSGSGSGDMISESGSESGSGIGSEYLAFIDLGIQTNIFSNIDDGTRAVGLPSAFSIGRHTYNTLYVRCSYSLLSYHISLSFDLDKL